jgi:hypothetical protein
MLKLEKILTDSISVGKGETAYSDEFKTSKSGGTLVVVAAVSAGSVSISQQCAESAGGTFHDPVSSANAALGAIATGFTVGSRYISISPVAAMWSRLKIVEANSAAAVVTVTVYQVVDTTWR